MIDNEEENERLDNAFNKLLQKFQENTSMFMYNYREKYLITEWLMKLKQSKSSLDERRLRNRFINYFVNSQEADVNIFNLHPFNKIPKDFSGPLTGFKRLLPKEPDEPLNPTEEERRSYITDLFDNLVDKGNFLAQQPVPRNGRFFILLWRQEDEALNCPKS